LLKSYYGETEIGKTQVLKELIRSLKVTCILWI